MLHDEGRPATVGVAVPVPDPFGTELQNWRREFGDPMADLIPTHITLVPPIELDQPDRDDLDTHLTKAAATVPPFRVHLRGTGTFRPISPVVFIALAEGIAACERLSGAVRSGPLDVALQYPYHPHVTVAHHLDDAALDRAFSTLAGYDASFEVSAFSLYEHGVDGYWRPVSDIPLTGVAGASLTGTGRPR